VPRVAPAAPLERRASIFVVDNNSRDGTDALVRDEFAEVELIPLKTNVGFCAANNVPIRRGSGEYVLVLNPDTEINAGALDQLLEVHEAPALDRHLPLSAGAARRELRPRLEEVVVPAPLRPSPPTGRLRSSGPADAVNGAFMLIGRRALDKVGFFDEGYGLYVEDSTSAIASSRRVG
jgi:GT2 family glycosyltransferase